MEYTEEFLPEITAPHRRTVIGDSEQLAATSIVLLWSNPGELLILGTDNRNVLAWTRKGYAKQGPALILNQETSRWIATRKCMVEGIYIRSGHNFSPDWMTRTDEHLVEEWAKKHGFTRLRLKPKWEEMMSTYREIQQQEIRMPDSRIPRQLDHLICVEWNGSGTSIAEAASIFGMTLKYLEPRHKLITQQFSQRYRYQPFKGERSEVLCGSARTEDEVSRFQEEWATRKHRVAILMAPLGVEMKAKIWDVYAQADGAQYGDILGSIWQVGIMGVAKVMSLTDQRQIRYVKTLGDRYNECNMLAVGDSRGIISHEATQYSCGQEVFIMDTDRNKRMSVNSGIRLLSLQKVKNNVENWPQVIGADGEVREVSLGEKCAVLGNKMWWKEIMANEKALIDTIWRSTPVAIWTEIVGEVIGGFDYLPYHQSVEEGALGADFYGFQHESGSGDPNPDALYQYWPDMNMNAGHGASILDSAGAGQNSSDFRVGTEMSMRRRSVEPHQENCACERYMENRAEFGPRPYVAWESLTDTATSLYEEDITGNQRLPKSKEEWDQNMEELKRKLHLMVLGGVGAPNLATFHRRLQRTLSEEEGGDDDIRTSFNFSLVRSGRNSPAVTMESGENGFRCGMDKEGSSGTRVGVPSIMTGEKLGTQDHLNALVEKSTTDETIRLLMNSLAPATQSAYLRNWKAWNGYCEAGNMNPWLNVSEDNWDMKLLNYLTWEHTVMKVGASALVSRYSAIKHIHLIEGRGDFEGKTH